MLRSVEPFLFLLLGDAHGNGRIHKHKQPGLNPNVATATAAKETICSRIPRRSRGPAPHLREDAREHHAHHAAHPVAGKHVQRVVHPTERWNK